MATVRQDKTKNRWVVDHSCGSYRKRFYFSTRREANDFNSVLILKGAGILADEHAPKTIQVQEAVQRYLAAVTTSKSVGTQYLERLIFQDFAEYFSGTYLHEVGLSELQGYQARLRHRTLGQSANRRFNTICHFFRSCVDWDLIKDNPCKRLRKLPVTGQRAKRALTNDELVKLLQSSKPWLRDVLWFILVLGLRRSQACYLRWGAIDFKGRFIHLEASEGFENKDYEANTLPMTDTTEGFLGRLFSDAASKGQSSPSDLVFVDNRGLFIRPDRLTKAAKKIMKGVLGIESGAVHILRHTSLTLRHRQGVSLDAVRAIAGHSNIKTTMLYLHSEPEYLRKELARTPILQPFWLKNVPSVSG